jgi:predicted RNA-binding Zn-ribbon protein involved in translation (DUF1610 family)
MMAIDKDRLFRAAFGEGYVFNAEQAAAIVGAIEEKHMQATAPLEERVDTAMEDHADLRDQVFNVMEERIETIEHDMETARHEKYSTWKYGVEKRLKELERKHDNHSHDESGRPIDTPEYDPRLQPGYADRPDPPPERECICGEDYVRYTSEDKILCANCHGVVKPELRVLEPEDRPEPRVKVVDWEKQIKTLQTDNAALREEVEDNRKETTDWHDYLTALQIKGILPDGADLDEMPGLQTTMQRLKALEDEVFDEAGIPDIRPRLESLEQLHADHIEGIHPFHRAPDPPPERPYTAVTCTKCKATRWINTGNDVHKCPRCGGMMIEEQEQDRPEPGFTVGDWFDRPVYDNKGVRCVSRVYWQLDNDLPEMWLYDAGNNEGYWEDSMEPADPPECLCEARKREEEAGMITLARNGKDFNYSCIEQYEDGRETFIYKMENCIHCKLPIRKSLIGGDE